MHFNQLPTISGLEELKSADTPIIKILFKIPSGVGAGMKPKSFSLPLNTTVVMLASHAASMVSTRYVVVCAKCCVTSLYVLRVWIACVCCKYVAPVCTVCCVLKKETGCGERYL